MTIHTTLKNTTATMKIQTQPTLIALAEDAVNEMSSTTKPTTTVSTARVIIMTVWNAMSLSVLSALIETRIIQGLNAWKRRVRAKSSSNRSAQCTKCSDRDSHYSGTKCVEKKSESKVFFIIGLIALLLAIVICVIVFWKFKKSKNQATGRVAIADNPNNNNQGQTRVDINNNNNPYNNQSPYQNVNENPNSKYEESPFGIEDGGGVIEPGNKDKEYKTLSSFKASNSENPSFKIDSDNKSEKSEPGKHAPKQGEVILTIQSKTHKEEN
eukprot:CAMPEP_0170536696 /NCGR_PEP_ID=MMETSP0209-20121228/102289_1 /TAXON_ID=665100 ORGANISM="Litonotus pictus, Strain P1" /NCGR_SAMPLE_ID=MMETSP0209 /ASSEMBLY_ACC=CAM_ASM_000301 /LENGTH=268 /DNA_ID=CAMNT_0010838083 /DNA_START=762 /DNA_END=1569 /DNA_ORIENTATION=-